MTRIRKTLAGVVLATVIATAVPGLPAMAAGGVRPDDTSGPEVSPTEPSSVILSTIRYELLSGAGGLRLTRQVVHPAVLETGGGVAGAPGAAAIPVPLPTAPGAEARPWSEVNRLWPVGKTAKVIDVRTGLTFEVKRQGGWAHVDAEPLTWADTRTMLDNYGGQWSWSRRPVVIILDDLRIAASQNGMPHGRSTVWNNGMNGHFCIHFLGSTTHGSVYTGTGRPSLDSAHQRAVQEAVGH